MPRVFVYGTLRPGEHNHHYLEAAAHLGHHTTAPRFTLYDTGHSYPAALDRGDTGLTGDVFAVDTATFGLLDALEGYPVHYTRRPLETPFGPAWIYLWVKPVAPHWPAITDGNWCRHRRRAGPTNRWIRSYS